MTDDAKLVEETLSGDREAFGLLVRKYQNAAYALAFQQLGSRTVAEEIAQDVFVAAYGKLVQLRDRNHLGAWLRAITLRRCGMWLRSQGRRPATRSLPTHLALTDAGHSDEAPFDVEALIGQLSKGLRAAAVLCFVDELSPSAAAAVLGLKPGTLRKRLHDARAQLQRQIVEVAEKELRMHLLPADFADRCICRCEKAQEARKEVTTMAEKKDCGCGCLGRQKARRTTKAKQKEKK